MTDRRRSAVGVLAGVGILVSTGWILFSRWANSPASTVGRIQVPAGVVEGESTEVGTKSYGNAHYSTTVPLNYVLKSDTDQPKGPVFAQVLFSAASSSPGTRIADQLAMTVGALPSDKLEGVSAVMMRSRTPDTYHPLILDWLPPGAKAFTSSGPESEISIFFNDSDKYAAVVTSGSPDRREVFKSMLKTIVENWRWN